MSHACACLEQDQTSMLTCDVKSRPLRFLSHSAWCLSAPSLHCQHAVGVCTRHTICNISQYAWALQALTAPCLILKSLVAWSGSMYVYSAIVRACMKLQLPRYWTNFSEASNFIWPCVTCTQSVYLNTWTGSRHGISLLGASMSLHLESMRCWCAK